MRLTFLGTGTSAGIPVLGCSCAVCHSSDPHNHRLRTSALLRVDGQQILIDAGPDFRMQALSQRLSHFDAILVTHAHYDHVAGLDDLRPITERRGHMPIYGIASTLEGIRERFSYAFVPIPDASTRPGMELIEITNHQPFSINGTEIMPLEIMHGTWRISAFRVGKLGYVTDASEIPPATMEQLRDLDVLVLNALRFKYHPTHFTLDQALEIVKQLRPRRTFFVHLTHAFDHTTVNAELPPGVALAYDGQEIEIEEFH